MKWIVDVGSKDGVKIYRQAGEQQNEPFNIGLSWSHQYKLMFGLTLTQLDRNRNNYK